MRYSQLFCRIVAFLCAVFFFTGPAHAKTYTVYFENSKGWATVSTWIWDKNDNDRNYTGGSWPGKVIYAGNVAGHPNLYSYSFECNASVPDLMCIFNDGISGHGIKGETQTEDLPLTDGYVYDIKGVKCHINDYGKSDPEPERKTYTIWFHNINRWPNVHVQISGTNYTYTGQLSSFLNSDRFSIEFKAPASVTDLKCSFYYLDGSVETDKTALFPVIDNHIYTQSGDKGDEGSYSGDDALPEKQYWIEPETPALSDEVTLYFNRAYSTNTTLKDTEDIYLWTWLKGGAGSECSAGSDWNLSDEDKKKLKMTKDLAIDPDGNVYTLRMSPSIATWFNATATDYTQLGLIFRDEYGNKRFDDQFVDLRVTINPGIDGLGKVQSVKDDGSAVTVTSERGTLTITPMSSEIVKVFTLPLDAVVKNERTSISVLPPGHDKYCLTRPDYTLTESDTEITISITDGIRLHVDKASSIISFCDANDEEYLRELAGLSNKVGNISVSFDAMGDEAFYGGGYNGNHINWDGKNPMVMNNTQTGGWGQGTSWPHNICIPFYVSTNGYGVYFDDHYRGASIRLSKNGTTYSSASRNPIAYYFIAGGERNGACGSITKVLENYTSLTGKSDLPPMWSLGYITSKFSFESRSEAEQAISGTKDIDIPIDGIVFDIHWQGGVQKMGYLNWDVSKYSNPSEMMASFKNDYKVHTIAITEPFFTSNSGNYEQLNRNGWFADNHVNSMEWLQSDNVGLIDITNADACRWFKDRYIDRTNEGVDSWWLDLGEPERHDPESTYVSGDVNQVHNEYGNRWIEVAYEALKECQPDQRHILLPRAGTSGMQRYTSFPWTGDIARSWSGLKAQVPALVSASMSGVSFLGSDIGGFTAYNGYTNANLYRRWVQLGVFYPMLRTHSATQPEVWQDVYASVRDDVRDAINLRYAYLPYTYTQAYAYSRYGTPIARPANFADTNRATLANETGAYFWGPDIFVAPVLDESTNKQITFPEGEWLDMTDWSSIYTSHQNVTYPAPVNVLPHFMRRGSIVARYRQDSFSNTADIATDKLTLDYFPSYEGQFTGSTLYDDDHNTADPIASGKYLASKFIVNARNSTDGNSISIYIEREGNGWEGMNPTQDILLQIHDFKLVNIDGSAFRLQPRGGNAAPASDRRKAPENTEFASVESMQALNDDNLTSNAFYIDTDKSKLYMRMPKLDARSGYHLEVGSPGVLTGLESATVGSHLELSCAAGLFSYSASEGIEGLSLAIYSIDGTLAGRFSDLVADGCTRQLSFDLASGFYIARLYGVNAEGDTVETTVKILK